MGRELWKDLGWAVLIGGLFGLSPHTSATRPIVKIVGGVAIAVVVLLLRLRARVARPAGSASPGGQGEAAARTPLGIWLALVLPFLLFLPAVTGLYRHYTEDIWTNGHGLFVPLVVAALVMATLRRDPSPEAESSAWGCLPLAAGLVLLVIDSAVVTLHLSILGLLLVLAGVSLVLLGPRRTRALAVPLALLLFLLPLPTSLAMTFGLTHATTVGAAMVFDAFGSPTILNDTVLKRPGGLFGVSAHCSGFSTLYAALALAVVLGFYGRSRVRFVLLLLAVWPLAALASILRTVAVIRVWESIGPGFHATPWHGLSGIAAFWFVMVVLFLMADRRGLHQSLA